MNKKVENIYNKIKKLQEELSCIQDTCKHPPKSLIKTYGANTGGYDGISHDLYWTNYHCKKCDKFWSADGSK